MEFVSTLESRRLMAAQAVLDDNGVLSVVGTDESETITVSYARTVTQTQGGNELDKPVIAVGIGETFSKFFDIGDVKSIKIVGLGGNDKITSLIQEPGRGSFVIGSFTADSLGVPSYIEGGSGNDRIVGGSGNDRISGGRGNDFITDAQGSNRINGDAGDDRIDARDGAVLTAIAVGDGGYRFDYTNRSQPDRVDGGEGNDTAVVEISDARVNVEAFNIANTARTIRLIDADTAIIDGQTVTVKEVDGNYIYSFGDDVPENLKRR